MFVEQVIFFFHNYIIFLGNGKFQTIDLALEGIHHYNYASFDPQKFYYF